MADDGDGRVRGRLRRAAVAEPGLQVEAKVRITATRFGGLVLGCIEADFCERILQIFEI